ncbi:TRAP transporter substrate-binding protein [Aureimonas populi]|uniref:TRAP transporter substrate-binding protein n=1 Tax=Aureimonas populi TaxID=1701758 RepID=A0ABW5CU10_9HYPH|nr:TRAP transporter substrate-binding protein [Aureimonas populi]
MSVRAFAAANAILLASAVMPAHAVDWDMFVVWPDNNYHSQNAMRFAEEVGRVTGGEVNITVHTGGTLGFRGPEVLGVVRDGIVPIADMLLNQQVGEEPFFGLESVPYLARNFEELAILEELAWPIYEELAAKHNQKFLYTTPWPGQGLFTRNEVTEASDIAGITIRTVDRNGTEFFTALGASPVQLPWGEVVSALASGAINAVTTSSASGVDGSFWEFLGYFNQINWQASPNVITVNLDAWNALSPEHQEAIETLAGELQPQFWDVARQTDLEMAERLAENGMTVTQPSDELSEELRAAAQPIWEDFMEAVPEGREVIEAYTARLAQ